ncbi:hypothetical protein [Arthrobacter sp. KNU40]|uniref:hypothetical protein n=1 Tax=Arthrobacter sp. KNU40 TaxID=3447965 RepID=UPI003F60F891
MTADFASLEWIETLRSACNASEEFRTATAFADTKLALMFGDKRYFWKIYKSAIIDSQQFVQTFDPLGYDVSIRASIDVWKSVAERRTKVWDHLNSFELEIGGNHLEAHRLHEALLIICQDILPALDNGTVEQ